MLIRALDFPQIKMLREYKRLAQASEIELAQITMDAGGEFYAPQTVEDLTRDGTELARQIAAQYTLTYRPSRPIANAVINANAPREIRVTARRANLQLRARRKYVVTQ